jgi:hypothetical protein
MQAEANAIRANNGAQNRSGIRERATNEACEGRALRERLREAGAKARSSRTRGDRDAVRGVSPRTAAARSRDSAARARGLLAARAAGGRWAGAGRVAFLRRQSGTDSCDSDTCKAASEDVSEGARQSRARANLVACAQYHSRGKRDPSVRSNVQTKGQVRMAGALITVRL